MLGAFALFLAIPVLRVLVAPSHPSRERRDRGWWAWLAATALVPALSFYPFMLLGAWALPPSSLFPQSITNQVMIWTLLNSALAALSFVWRKGAPQIGFSRNWPSSIAIAVLTVGMAYIALALSDYLFKIDFRLWVVALKLLSAKQFLWFLAYLIPFTIAFTASLRGMTLLMVKDDSAGAQYAVGLTALAGGFLLFVVAEYAPLFIGGALLVPQEALNAIISLQFVPLLAIIGLIAVFTWRRTNSSLPGALIAGLLVSWYVVAGTAVQYAG
jgi:hypothetical protein